MTAAASPVAPPLGRRAPIERPILFSGPMVKAILDGRKTQTRRLATGLSSRYGQPGDRLWVRETWYCDHMFVGDVEATNGSRQTGKLTKDECIAEWRGRNPDGSMMYYRADGEAHRQFEQFDPENFAWRPSIFMPRWASRILLEVTEVRTERLQALTENDAKAEGLGCLTKDGKLLKYGIPDADGMWGTDDHGWPWDQWDVDPVKAYAKLWDSINGDRASWASNPPVWVVSFRRLG